MTRRRFAGSLLGMIALESVGAGAKQLAPPITNQQRPIPARNKAGRMPRPSALKTRQECALRQGLRPVATQINNGDEKLFRSGTVSFTKGLPHGQSGEVEPGCYASLLDTLESGDSEAFQKMARGSGMRFSNPQAAFSVHLEGGDAQTFACRPAPSISSAEGAADMVELCWQVLARDVPFSEYEQSSVTAEATQDLNRLSGFAGPKNNQQVTPETVFRGDTSGNMAGPYISQFLWKPIPCNSGKQEQRYRSPETRNDFLDTYPEWLQLQTGVPPWRSYRWRPEPRYILTGRDLAEYVHYDFLYQHFLNAALILMDLGPHSIYNSGYYLAETNPYKHSKTMTGFVTFGSAQIADWIGRVTTAALKAAWFQKWRVHRRLRPEEFGGLIHRNKTGVAEYPLHVELMESQALKKVHDRFGTFLLPQAYPEGSPLHPAYPAGHATVSGACATMLKALFDEQMAVPDAVVPSEDGKSLLPYKGGALTVKGEVEKLAFNIAMGRNFAGIHYRSDATAGIRLGEEVAISVLEDLVNTFAEDFQGFQYTRFDGEPVRIAKAI